MSALGAAAVTCAVLLQSPGRRPAESPLSAAAEADRLREFEFAPPIAVAAVLPQERAWATASMQVPEGQLRQLEQQRPELIWLTLFDDRHEDGDAVAVISDGFSQLVQLTHQPVRVALPRPRNGIVLVRGEQDGSGGITVAVVDSTGPLPMPVMRVGQVVRLPVR